MRRRLALLCLVTTLPLLAIAQTTPPTDIPDIPDTLPPTDIPTFPGSDSGSGTTDNSGSTDVTTTTLDGGATAAFAILGNSTPSAFLAAWHAASHTVYAPRQKGFLAVKTSDALATTALSKARSALGTGFNVRLHGVADGHAILRITPATPPARNLREKSWPALLLRDASITSVASVYRVGKGPYRIATAGVWVSFSGSLTDAQRVAALGTVPTLGTPVTASNGLSYIPLQGRDATGLLSAASSIASKTGVAWVLPHQAVATAP